ncbi:hypothetical protein O8C79_12565, partial [Aliarcobacter butzleri]|uniref:hypothetical protein n=1 Tax=Aliarcobacter butzleri TaxID=28197 RepID=UPI00263D04D3
KSLIKIITSISNLEKIKYVKIKPKNPDKKEKKKLSIVQKLFFIFGRIKLLERVIKTIAKIVIKKAVLMLKIIVEKVCRF